MGTTRNLDCVEMKNRIQREMFEEEERIGEEEVRKRRREWLATSDSPLARLWRDSSEE